MSRVLARSLSRKKIVTNEGKVIGTLKNLVVDFDTGQVVDLVVYPDPSFDTTGYRVEGDRLFVAFEAVKDIKDFIVVDRYL
jgi:sporulation protein YlmC with PRC-barrel domain